MGLVPLGFGECGIDPDSLKIIGTPVTDEDMFVMDRLFIGFE